MQVDEKRGKRKAEEVLETTETSKVQGIYVCMLPIHCHLWLLSVVTVLDPYMQREPAAVMCQQEHLFMGVYSTQYASVIPHRRL